MLHLRTLVNMTVLTKIGLLIFKISKSFFVYIFWNEINKHEVDNRKLDQQIFYIKQAVIFLSNLKTVVDYWILRENFFLVRSKILNT